MKTDRESCEETLVDVIDSAKSGNVDAFETIVKRLHNRMLAYCYRVCEGHPDYEDVAQVAWMKVRKMLPGFAGKGLEDVRKLACMCAKQASVDAFRKRLRFPSHLPTNANGQSPDVPERSLPTLDIIALRECLEKHEGNANIQVWKLKRIDGLSYDEISERLDMTQGNIASKISRATEKLKSCIEGIVA